MKILFWDIDGTLIRTNRAGLYAFEQATIELFGKKSNYDKVKTAGMTDNYIAQQVLELLLGRLPLPEEVAALTRRYEELLPSHLNERHGFILPFVRDTLERIHDTEDMVSLLLTGNSRVGSEIKLRYFALSQYFDFEHSAFCDGCCERNEIAAKGLAAARQHYSQAGVPQLYVIGDTPNDIACGNSIGARTVAVATGGYTVSELAGCNPWWALNHLPEPEDFINKLVLDQP